MSNHKKNIWEFSKKTLTEALVELDIAPSQCKMRVAQIWRGIYIDGIKDFKELTTISKPLRELIAQNFSLARPEVLNLQTSKDGTKKYLLEMKGKNPIEMVFIPEKTRGTLCLSSQVGCTLTCHFCHTGTQKWQRNLSAGEIVSQILVAFDNLNIWCDKQNRITNIVFMGQGEPLFNLEAVIAAIKIICDEDGLAFSKRRITVSTAGVVPNIKSLGNAVGVKLAISLHAVDDEKRTKLIPLNNKYNLALLLDACRDYPKISNGRRITFEYIMLDGINDSDNEAHKLVQLIKGMSAKINLIPFNPWTGSGFKPSPKARIKSFAKIISDAGYASPVRTPRGLDINAACGQLKSDNFEELAVK